MAQYENENVSGLDIAEPGIANQPNGDPGKKENPTNADTQVLNADEDVINGDTNNPVTNSAEKISAGMDENEFEEETHLTDEDEMDDDLNDDDFDDEDLDEEDEDEADNNVRDAFNDDSLKASE